MGAYSRGKFCPTRLLGSKWTAVSRASRDKYFVVTAWAAAPTDCDGAPDSVILEGTTTGRSMTVSWRSLRNASAWRQGWS